MPAPPDYLTYKRNVYLVVESRWEPFFVEDADIDWRMVSWGGVLIDDRPYDETDAPCNCIPAADNPRTTDVAGGDVLGPDLLDIAVEELTPSALLCTPEGVVDVGFVQSTARLHGWDGASRWSGELEGFRPIVAFPMRLARTAIMMPLH